MIEYPEDQSIEAESIDHGKRRECRRAQVERQVGRGVGTGYLMPSAQLPLQASRGCRPCRLDSDVATTSPRVKPTHAVVLTYTHFRFPPLQYFTLPFPPPPPHVPLVGLAPFYQVAEGQQSSTSALMLSSKPTSYSHWPPISVGSNGLDQVYMTIQG